MFENQRFSDLVENGQPTGEVIAVTRFLITVAGLNKVPTGSLVLFNNGHFGLVQTVAEETILILNMSAETIPVGTLAVLVGDSLAIPVGKGLIGRIINPLAVAIDGNGLVEADSTTDLFNEPPKFNERAILNEQLETGVAIVDTLFPIVLGQRIGVLGDAKSGKTTFLTQMMIHQAKQGHLIVYVMIGKRKTDVDLLISRLIASNAKDNVILVVADVFDSLAMTYLAPYSGCAIAEYFWRRGQDVIVVYDDLSNHAKAYRELSLTLKENPGRESYPSNMFHAHSSLLERAGKLLSNNKSLTALPVAITPSDDVTGYLSTNLISITDGQIVFDLETMRKNIRPAVNAGLSVSRIGGRAQTKSFRDVATRVTKYLATFRGAQEVSQFGSELSASTRKTLMIGQRIYDVFKQKPEELYSTFEQQILLQTILLSEEQTHLSVDWLKSVIHDIAKTADTKTDTMLLAKGLIHSNPMVRSGK